MKKKEIDYSIKKQFAFKFMYLGSNYDGLVFQSTTHNTIEEVLFNAMKRCALIEDKPIETLMGELNYSRCGRTDKGVNSSGNAFSLMLRYNSNYNYVKTINNLLPNDISLLSCIEVDDSFDARFSCLYREYKYYFLQKGMNIDLINKAAKLLQGVHDFKKFCKIDKSDPNYKSKNYERRIYEIYIDKATQFLFPYNLNSNISSNNNENANSSPGEYYEMYVCTIKGSAFLWHQVRCIMGILFLIGSGQEQIEIIHQMLETDSGNDYEFHYTIADDTNLILTDCVFEFYDFDIKNEETASNIYFKLDQIYQKNLMQIAINSHFFNVINGSHRELNKLSNIEMVKNFELNHRRKGKYTKMLQHKTNRQIQMKNSQNKKKDKEKKDNND